MYKHLFILIALLLLLAACYPPAYISVMGTDETSPESVSFVVNSNRPKERELWLYAVDGIKVKLEPAKREHYAITPGIHTLWVLAPMHITHPLDVFSGGYPNRCYVFEVNLVAGKSYFLRSIENTKEIYLETDSSDKISLKGRLVDESWWTCYWDK